MPSTRTAFSNLLAVQTVRRLEDDQPTYYPDVDLRLSREARRDADGRLTQPVAVLRERSAEVLETRHGLSVKWIGEAVGWLKVVRVIGCVVVLIVAFGAAEAWFSEGEQVNVEWIFGFLATLVVSMTVTTLLMLTAAFARRSKPDRQAGIATRSLAKLLVVHWVFLFLVRRVLPWVQKRILKQHAERTAEEDRRLERLSEAAFDTLSRQSRRVALETAATSNLLWLLASLGVFVSLCKMTLFREYDFRWQATIVSEEFMLDATQWLARPIQDWPMASMPTPEDVHWLNTGQLPETVGKSLDEGARLSRTHAIRQTWGRLFLAFLLYYGVAPRALLTLIAFFMARRSWRGLQPRTSDPYFRQILDWIETPPFHTTQEQEPEPEQVAVAEAALPVVPSPSVVEAEPEELPAEPPRLGDVTAVLSFDLEPPTDGWAKTLPFPTGGEVLDLGNAGTRDSRRRAVGELQQRRADVAALFLIANLVDNPDGLFEDFVRQITEALHPPAAKALLLSGGERLRKRYAGDAAKIADRVELWTERSTRAGIDPDKVVEFDVEHATAAAREALRERLALFRPTGAAEADASGGVCCAGQFRRAAALISGYAGRDAARKDADELRSDAVRLHEEIRELYQKQASQLERAFQKVSIDTNRIRAAVSETANLAKGQLDKFEHLSRMSEQLARYTRGLSGRWAVAGGLLCGIGGGALTVMAAPGVLPAILPAAFLGAKAGLLGGVISAHAPHLAAKLGWRRAATEEESAEVAEPTFTLDDLVRTNALWALILEFQGTPEERIARLLEDVLGDVSEEPLINSEDVQRWLSELVDRTEQLVLVHV